MMIKNKRVPTYLMVLLDWYDVNAMLLVKQKENVVRKNEGELSEIERKREWQKKLKHEWDAVKEMEDK